MCGIFGTTNPRRDLNALLLANAERGVKSISFFTPNMRLVTDVSLHLEQSVNPFGIYDEPFVLGHTHAPTREPNADRHPFQWGDWFVAHNGVIHNRKEWGYWGHDTDSSVLPRVIFQNFRQLGELQGTFACWAYDYTKKQTYLFRWVNPLYTTSFLQTKGQGGAFSSVPIPDLGIECSIPEGLVINWPQGQPIDNFSPKEHPYR
jgi:asparagine synthetase B (glutamine-hydrolysing)